MKIIFQKSELFAINIVGKIIQTVGGKEFPPKRKKTYNVIHSIFINNVKNKHIEAMQKWENENPDWRRDHKQTGRYIELIKKSTEELDEEERNRILDAVSKETEIK